MNPKDAILLDRWTATRDATAFDELVSRYVSMVYATCRRLLQSHADAEDVTQECFITLAHPRTRVRTSLAGWLHKAATNRSISCLRKASRRQRYETQYKEESKPSEEPAWDDIQEHVDEAIEALPEKLRVPVIGSFLQRQTHQELAVELGVTRQAVTYRVNKGVEEIRKHLKRKGISIATASLAALLGTGLVEAVPPTLLALLGKLALLGASTVAVGGTTKLLSMAGLGKLLAELSAIQKAATAVSIAGLLAGGIYVGQQFESGSQSPSGPERAVATGTVVARQNSAGEATMHENGVLSGRSTNVLAKTTQAVVADKETQTVTDGPDDDARLVGISSTVSREEREIASGLIANEANYITVSGMVFSKGGQAIPNAEVTVIAQGPRVNNWMTWRAFRDVERHYRTKTDAEGWYEIHGIRYLGPAHISASAEGFVSDSAHPRFIKGETKVTQDFPLGQEGMPLVGRLISPAGDPVSDAFVFAPVFVSNLSANSDSREAFAYTNADGVFRLGLKHESAYRDQEVYGTKGWATLIVESRQHGPAIFKDVPAGLAGITEVQMSEPASLSGEVQVTSAGPHYVSLTAILEQPYYDEEGNPTSRTALDKGLTATYSGFINPDGSYVVDRIPSTTDFRLVVVQTASLELHHREPYAPFSPKEHRQWNKVIGGQLIVAGRVTGVPSGKPLPGVKVTYGDVPRELRGHVNALTGPQGEYRLVLGGEAGSYLISPSHRQISSWYDLGLMMKASAKRVELTPNQPVVLDLELTDPLTVVVQAVDEKGEAVPEAEVWLGFARRGFTNKEGMRVLRLGTGTSHDITAKKDGYVTTGAYPLYWGDPGEIISDRRIVMYRAAGGLEGTFVSWSSGPLANQAIWAIAINDEGERFTMETKTDGQGKFTYLNWPAVGYYPQIVLARKWSGSGARYVAILRDIEMVEGEVVIVNDVLTKDYREQGNSPVNVTLSNVPESNDRSTIMALPADIEKIHHITAESINVRASILMKYAEFGENPGTQFNNLAPGTYTFRATSWPTGRTRTVEQYGGYPKYLDDLRVATQLVEIPRGNQELSIQLTFPDHSPGPGN